MTRNEAAERLREMVDSQSFDGPFAQVLDAALAEERRHVIEQISDAVTRLTEETLSPPTLAEFRAILDDLSAPEQERCKHGCVGFCGDCESGTDPVSTPEQKR